MSLTIPPSMGFKIVHVVESLEPQAGSAIVCVAGLSRELGRRGIVSEVVDSANASETVGRLAEADIVHFHGWDRKTFEGIAASLRKAKTPYVLSPLGGLCPNRFTKTSIWDRLSNLFRADCLVEDAAAIAACNDVERNLLSELKVRERLSVAEYGLDVSSYGSVAAGSVDGGRDGNVALVLGPIHPAEGLVPLLKAGAEAGLDSNGWSIVIAGPEVGDWRKMIEAAVNRKGAADRVRFVPAADEGAQKLLLREADLLIAASMQPRCPVSILQAVASGVPVIATHAVCPNGLTKQVRVCEPSREGLRLALREFMKKNVAEHREEARRTREQSVRLIDWTSACEAFLIIYESVLGKTGFQTPREASRVSIEARSAMVGDSRSSERLSSSTK